MREKQENLEIIFVWPGLVRGPVYPSRESFVLENAAISKYVQKFLDSPPL